MTEGQSSDVMSNGMPRRYYLAVTLDAIKSDSCASLLLLKLRTPISEIHKRQSLRDGNRR